MEKININKNIIKKTNTLKIVNDIIVPDIKPDIINIITTNGIPYIYKQECENGKIKVDGMADCYIVYLSADGESRSIQASFNFSNVLEDSKILENSKFKYKVNMDSIDVKILNERKISVTITISIEYCIFEIRTIEISNDFLENIPNIQKLEENLMIKSLVGVNTSKTTIKEDINIENLDNIGEILKIDLKIKDVEQKISYNKVLTKGECNIKVLYITDDNRIGRVESSIPIMSFIDLENVVEGNDCIIEYNIRNILFKINSREEHSITVQIDFEILCEAYENKNVVVLKDAYSLNNNLDVFYKNIEIDEINRNNEVIDIDEKIKVEDINNILEIEEKNIKIVKNDKFNIEGEINLLIYYDSLSKSGLNVKEIKIPFICKAPNRDKVEIEMSYIDYKISGDNIILNIKLNMKFCNNNSSNVKIIEDIKINENLFLEDYNVVVYIIKKDDSIWSIAKKFNVTIDSIIRVNNLENPSMIYPGDKLYILR